MTLSSNILMVSKMSVQSLQYLIGALFLLNVGGIIWLFESKKSLKKCENSTSPFCHTFTCPEKDLLSGTYKPWRCKNTVEDTNTCSTLDSRMYMNTTSE